MASLADKLRALWGTAVPAKSAPATAVAPVFRRVLLIIHNPQQKGQKLHHVMQWNDPDELARQYIRDLQQASSGYLNYEITERIEVDAFPRKEDGFQYDIDTYLYRWRSRTGFHVPDRVDYAALMRQFKVVPRINLDQIDEVWLMAFPYAGYFESIMAGPDAFWCNAPPLVEIGRCSRRFIIMGFNYERGVGEMLESFGHRAESIMAQVYRQKRGEANLWQRFTRHEKTHPGHSECGTVHFAPNSERDYDWGNQRYVRSFCDNWLQFPDLTAPTRRVNCGEWGGGNIHAHHIWWLAHIPNGNGRTGGISHNWWSYIADPNLVR